MRTPTVGAQVPTRAREAARADREAARPAASVKVEHLTPGSAARAGRYQVPQSWSGHDLVLRVSSVLADRTSPQVGLVLSSMPVVVCHEEERGTPVRAFASHQVLCPTVVVLAWAADSTMRLMSEQDWRFVAGAGRDVVVPAVVSSHLRALAFYSSVPVRSVELLRRWKAAREQVLAQVEVLESVFGSPAPAAGDAVLDMTGEQVLRQRDGALAAAWCQQAKTIAAASKVAYARAVTAWMVEQECQTVEGVADA